jgi:hypothetical protein
VANATAPGARTTESTSIQTGSPRGRRTGVLPLDSRPLALLWAVFVAALAAFLAFGVLRVGGGFRIGSRLTVREIWSQFVAFLAGKGFTPVLITGVTLLLFASLVLAAIYLWFAFMLKDGDLDVPADDISGP